MLNKVLLAVAFVLLTGCSHVNIATTECKVTGKESIQGKDSHQYRVYTTCGTYIIEDQLTRGVFDSADTYGAIEVGKTYRITSSGYRVPFLSMFKAINELELVK